MYVLVNKEAPYKKYFFMIIAYKLMRLSVKYRKLTVSINQVVK